MRASENNEAYWAGHVRRFRASGLSPSEYSAQHGLSVAHLRDWVKREAAKPGALTLVAAQGPTARGAPAACVLRGESGFVLEFPAGAPASYLADLLRLLR